MHPLARFFFIQRCRDVEDNRNGLFHGIDGFFPICYIDVKKRGGRSGARLLAKFFFRNDNECHMLIFCCRFYPVMDAL